MLEAQRNVADAEHRAFEEAHRAFEEAKKAGTAELKCQAAVVAKEAVEKKLQLMNIRMLVEEAARLYFENGKWKFTSLTDGKFVDL